MENKPAQNIQDTFLNTVRKDKTPITIYLVSELVDFRQIAMHFAGGDVSNWLNKHLTAGAGDMLVSLIAVGLVFTFMRFLYQRKIFLRL